MFNPEGSFNPSGQLSYQQAEGLISSIAHIAQIFADPAFSDSIKETYHDSLELLIEWIFDKASEWNHPPEFFNQASGTPPITNAARLIAIAIHATNTYLEPSGELMLDIDELNKH